MSDEELSRHVAGLPDTQVLYTDFDGTLLGPRGALLTSPDGAPSSRAAAALVRAAEARLVVVPVSGRGVERLRNDARLLGLDNCIAEAGGVIVREDQMWFEWGQCPEGLADTPHGALEAAGALALVLERFGGDIRPYEPWCHGRLGGHLLHGYVDVGAINTTLEEAGLGWAYLVDNGAAGGWPGREVHAYHLLPRGVGKGQAVADDLAARGLDAEQAAAIGDSEQDRTMAAVVGTYFEVANARTPPADGFWRLDEAMGYGFAQAVSALLAARATPEPGSPTG